MADHDMQVDSDDDFETPPPSSKKKRTIADTDTNTDGVEVEEHKPKKAKVEVAVDDKKKSLDAFFGGIKTTTTTITTTTTKLTPPQLTSKADIGGGVRIKIGAPLVKPSSSNKAPLPKLFSAKSQSTTSGSEEPVVSSPSKQPSSSSSSSSSSYSSSSSSLSPLASLAKQPTLKKTPKPTTSDDDDFFAHSKESGTDAIIRAVIRTSVPNSKIGLKMDYKQQDNVFSKVFDKSPLTLNQIETVVLSDRAYVFACPMNFSDDELQGGSLVFIVSPPASERTTFDDYVLKSLIAYNKREAERIYLYFDITDEDPNSNASDTNKLTLAGKIDRMNLGAKLVKEILFPYDMFFGVRYSIAQKKVKQPKPTIPGPQPGKAKSSEYLVALKEFQQAEMEWQNHTEAIKLLLAKEGFAQRMDQLLMPYNAYVRKIPGGPSPPMDFMTKDFGKKLAMLSSKWDMFLDRTVAFTEFTLRNEVLVIEGIPWMNRFYEDDDDDDGGVIEGDEDEEECYDMDDEEDEEGDEDFDFNK